MYNGHCDKVPPVILRTGGYKSLEHFYTPNVGNTRW